MTSQQVLDRRLILFWIPNSSSDSPLPEWLQENIQGWSTYNPDLNIELINDNDVIPVLSQEYPELCKLYVQIAIPSCKSDIARVLWLYKYGGLYLDVHTACKRNINQLLRTADLYDLLIPFHPEHLEDHEAFTHPLRSGILFAKKGARFLQELLADIEKNLTELKQLQDSSQWYDYNISAVTGPRLIARKLRRESDDIASYPTAHCDKCAKLAGQLNHYNARLVDLEEYVAWHKFSSYRMQGNRYLNHHWTVLQTQIKLFLENGHVIPLKT